MSAKSKNKVEALACRGCLSTGGKLYSILDANLLETYEDFTGYRVRSAADQYPKYLCMYCHTQLLSFQKFQKKCKSAIDVLKEAQRAGYKLTTDYISSIDRKYYNLNINLARTKTDIIECVQNLNYTNVIFVKQDQNLATDAAKLANSEENNSDGTEYEDDYEIIDKTQHIGNEIGKNEAKFVSNDKMFQDDTNNTMYSSRHEFPKLLLDKGKIGIVNNDEMLQNNPKNTLHSNKEEWSDEYLDFDSDSNDEAVDSNTKIDPCKIESVDVKYKNDNCILKSLLMNKNSTIGRHAIKDPNFFPTSNNNVVVEKNASNINKNVSNTNKSSNMDKEDASSDENESTVDRNASDDDEIKESDSEIDELINLFLNSPKDYDKIEKKVINTDAISIRKANDENRKRKANFAKSYDEIPKKIAYSVAQQYSRLKSTAEKLDFNVKLFTPHEQFKEVEERRKATIQPPCTTKCKDCGEDFESEGLKKNHVEKCHNPNAPRCCQICYCRFKGNMELALHMRTHKYEFSCKNCKFVTKNKTDIAHHYKNVHTDEVSTYVCAYCGKVFKQYMHWNSHLRTKHPTKLLSCDLCKAGAFLNTIALKKHYDRAHSDVKEVSCNCNSTFLSLSALAKHKESNRCDLFPCKRCGVNVSTEKHLKYHLFKHRMQCDMAEDYYHECGGCKVMFQNADALDVHVERCLEGGYPCVHCGDSLGSSDLLTKHMFETHTLEEASFNIKNVKLPGVVCQDCGKSFKDSRLLKQHRNFMHLGRRRPWPAWVSCQLCSKSFRGRSSLMEHMNAHTGGPFFPCQHCDKVFKWKGGRYKHILRFHTEKPYLCVECGKKFLKEHLLEAHVAKKHSKVRGTKKVGKKQRKSIEKDETVEYDMTEYDDTEYLVVEEHSSE